MFTGVTYLWNTISAEWYATKTNAVNMTDLVEDVAKGYLLNSPTFVQRVVDQVEGRGPITFSVVEIGCLQDIVHEMKRVNFKRSQINSLQWTIDPLFHQNLEGSPLECFSNNTLCATIPFLPRNSLLSLYGLNRNFNRFIASDFQRIKKEAIQEINETKILFPNLAILKQKLKVIGANITHLNLSKLIEEKKWEIPDSAFLPLFKLCPNLTHLNLYCCRELTNETLSSLCDACPKLIQLNIDKCSQLRGGAQIVNSKLKLECLHYDGTYFEQEGVNPFWE